VEEREDRQVEGIHQLQPQKAAAQLQLHPLLLNHPQHLQTQAHPKRTSVKAPATTPSTTPAPPAPSPPAPSPVEAKEDDVIVYVTTTAPPEIVTVHAMAPKEKRHDHVHQHAHPKINKKRHGNN